MTFSIAGFDPANGDLGVAVASRFPCVGAVVPAAKAGVGAVATQAWANAAFGPDGIDAMSAGRSAEAASEGLLAADEGRDDRQLGIVDARGGVATFTGSRCMDWAGGIAGETCAIQGNILVGPEVVHAMAAAFDDTGGDLCDRLLAALLAGDEVGGDRRGRQSAAMVVVREGGGYEGRTDRYIDLRVDDHPEAPGELARLFGVWDDVMLVRNDPLVAVTPELVMELQRRLAALARLDGAALTGSMDHATRAALEAWAGEVNLEGRLRDDDQLSANLLRELRDITPDVHAP
ncbi:MAG TPA: DUF1028 domain-containing protein [Actinomycetota bacterium]